MKKHRGMYMATPPACEPRRRPPCRWSWLFALILAVGPVTAVEEVVVVRSSAAQPYAVAGEQVRANMAAQEYGVTVVNLAELSAQDGEQFKAWLATKKVKAFVAIGSNAAVWLHARVPQEIGVSYCMVSNPEVAGLFAGRKSVGVSTTVAYADQIKLMQATVPGVKRVGMLYSAKSAESLAAMEMMKKQIPKGMELVSVAVDEYDTVSAAIQALLEQKPELVWTTPDSTVYSSAAVRSLLLLGLRQKVPVFGFSAPFVKAGALVGVGIAPEEQGKQCAGIVRDYLSALAAQKLAEFYARVRVEAPHFQVAINQIVARQLECEIPEKVAAAAEIVYDSQ